MFLGNCQPSDSVEICVFDLNDESKWKPMSEEAIKSVCAPGATTSLPPFPPLCASTIDASVTSNEIEMQLRLLVSEHRKVIKTEVCSCMHFFHVFMCVLNFFSTCDSASHCSISEQSKYSAYLYEALSFESRES